MESEHLAQVRRRAADQKAYRRAATALGLLVGFVVGLALEVGLTLAGVSPEPSPWWVLGTSAVGAAAGFASPLLGIGLAEGLVHWVAGFLTAEAWPDLESPDQVPTWLKAVFWFGVACAVLAYAWWGPRGCT